MNQTTDNINHPAHYNAGKVETIDCIESVVAGYSGPHAYLCGNIVKYLSRAPFKGNKIEDLGKARWYLERLIQAQGSES